MSHIVIKVNNISKQYRLGQIGTGTISHDLNRWWHKMRGKEDPYLKIGETNRRDAKSNDEYSWALRDISFEVKSGEVLGIIGKNGAGKSTLLKILSRVTSPTIGEYKVNGRIASLLEVGTGFHPELTGRENVFLNGSILGMTKAEIKSKFDEIVAFSGVERYIDTPVKRYSSGMSVRLAFAVAAHLEPEILIIDEVLAVGDADFQKKCLGKMKDVANEGRTVLFVSHNMSAVKSLCNKSLYLVNGQVRFLGETNSAIAQYMGYDTKSVTKTQHFKNNDFANEYYELKSIKLTSENENTEIITMNDSFAISTSLVKKRKDYQLDIAYHVTDPHGTVLLISASRLLQDPFDNQYKSGTLTFTCNFPANFFNEGEYGVNIYFMENRMKVIDTAKGFLTFTILPGTEPLGQWMGKTAGFFRLINNKWEFKHEN